MKNIKKILIAGVIEIFVISSVGCSMVAKTPEAIKKSPVAKVNGETITKEQLDSRMLPVAATFTQQFQPGWESNTQYKKQFEDEKVNMRQSMIEDIIVLQHAKAAKVLPTDKEIEEGVKTQLDEAIKSVGDDAKFAEALKTYGFTKETYTEFLKGSVKVTKAQEGLVKDLKVDESKVQAEYDTNKNIKYTKKPNLMHIQRILVATEAEAKTVVDRINKGEAFDVVAKAVSTDTTTKDQGGDLADYYYDEALNQNHLEPAFVTAAMALEVNKISAPVETSEGWYIIKLTKKEVYEAETFDTVKEFITKTLLDTLKKETMTANIKKWETELGKKIVKEDKNM